MGYPSSGFSISRKWAWISFHPWVYFFLFLSTLSLLSYAPLLTPFKITLLILGLFLPFTFGGVSALKERSGKNDAGNLSSEFFHLKPWHWLTYLSFLLLTRFYGLTTLPFWPMGDEAIYGMLGWHQSRQWKWRVLWHDGLEPFLFWFLGLYFKLIQPSFFSLRLFPALFSVLTCLVAYWAARQYFSKSLAFIATWFFTFSFWEWILARNCLPPLLVVLFQCLCLGWLGIFLKRAASGEVPWKTLGILALFSGLGFYTWLNWAGVWLGLASVLFFHFLGGYREKKYSLLILGGLETVLLVFPLALARMTPDGMSLFQEHLSFSVLKPLFLYLQGIFWNGSPSFPFGPNWGGFLNPILGSLFFLGLIDSIKSAGKKTIAAFSALLVFSLLPGILTGGMELLRIVTFMPFSMILAALGFRSLLRVGPAGRPTIWIFFLLAASMVLDIYNFTQFYCRKEGVPETKQWRTIQYYDAFEALQAIHKDSGSLYVFLELNTDYDNKTLNLACYPFNAAQNDSLIKSNPKWVVLILNQNYFPFFKKKYPQLEFKILETDKTRPYDPKPFAMFLIPTDQIPKGVLDRWIEADRVFQEVDFKMENKKPKDRWSDFMGSLFPSGNPFPSDRFLTSVFWEKTGFFKFLDGRFLEAAQAYRNAILGGFPAAHLYYDLGVCLKVQGRTSEAEECFRKAGALSGEKKR